MSGFWSSQLDYIFLVYGLSFVLMAAQCLVLRARDRSLPWGLLAAFVIIHGVNEWLDMLAISLPDTPIFKGARLVVMAVSFVALVEFGRRGDGRPLAGRWLTPALLGLAALGALSGDMNGLNAACRYTLGFPGAVMAAVVLWRVSRACAGSQRYGLRLAALSMLVYGFATGLVVPKAAFFPADWLNHDAFLSAAGFPVQLIRALCAFAAMAGFWIRGLHGESSMEQIGFIRRWSCPAALLLLVALGWFVADSRGKRTGADMRHQLVGQAARIAHAVNPQHVKALSFTAADKGNPSFQCLREEMVAYSQSVASRFGGATQYLSIYSMIERDGAIIFGPESIDEDDSGASKPGTVYEEPPPGTHSIFHTGRAFTYGPYTDEHGTFVSAFAPVLDPRTGKALMVVGRDTMADDWRAQVAAARLLPIMGALALILIWLGGTWAIHWRNALTADRRPRFRHLEPALVAAVGLALTVMLSLLTLESDNRERGRAFQEIAQTHAEKASDGFSEVGSDVAALGRFMQIDKQADDQEFRDFVAPVLSDSAVQAFENIPRVPAAEKKMVEVRARRAGITGYTIWEKDRHGQNAPASGRPDYYPVDYVQPLEGNECALGFDLGSEPIRRAALEKAAWTGFPTATSPVTLVQDAEKQQATLLFHPELANHALRAGSARRMIRVRGFALGVIRYQTLLERALGSSDRGDDLVDTRLVDLMATGGPRLLAEIPKVAARNHPSAFAGSLLGRHVLSDISPIFAFGRAYAVVSHPTSAFYAAYPSRYHVVTGIAGLFITTLLSLLAGFIRNRQTFMEREVRERIGQLRESEEHLSTTLNSIGDAVISTDTNGRVVGMNPAAEQLTGWVLSEVVGLPIAQLLNIVNALTHEPAAIPIDEVLSTGEVCHLANYTTLISRDGTRRQIADSAAPIRDDSGAITGVVLVFSDVTEQYRIREELKEARDRAQRYLDIAGVMLVGIARDQSITLVNKQSCAQFGYTQRELLGKNWFDICIPEREREEVMAGFAQLMQGNTEAFEFFENAVVTRSGEERTISWHNVLLRDATGAIIGTLSSGEDITERKQAEEKLRQANAEIDAMNRQLLGALTQANRLANEAEQARGQIEEHAVELSHQATHDALTGLPNRKYFEQHLGGLTTGSAGRRSRSFTMLFLDLDKFKLINDTLGHKIGDLLLVEVAVRLQSCLRSEDVLARMSGDEFTAILPRCRSHSVAESVASRMIDSISRPLEIQGHRFVIGASIGLASYPSDGADTVSLIKHADGAMYKAKHAGRGTFRWYSGDVDKDNQSRIEIERDIRAALEKGEFNVCYQPIVSLEHGNIIAAEALLRWEHPEKGMISPSLFIPIAEEIGVIGKIGDYVLRTACAQKMAWRDEGIHLSQIAVNVSTRQVHDASWLDSVSAVLSDTGLDARCLNLELTESNFAADYESMRETLRKVRELGICLSIDDFGIGQSSLGRLKDFPVIHLKIDGSFVRDIEHNKNDNALVRSIVEMAHGQGIKVTAEWVETESQMEILRSIGCDFAQGYFISPALPADKFREFVVGRVPLVQVRQRAA